MAKLLYLSNYLSNTFLCLYLSTLLDTHLLLLFLHQPHLTSWNLGYPSATSWKNSSTSPTSSTLPQTLSTTSTRRGWQSGMEEQMSTKEAARCSATDSTLPGRAGSERMARRDCKRTSHDYLTVRSKPLWSHKEASVGMHVTSSPKRDLTFIYERVPISWLACALLVQ